MRDDLDAEYHARLLIRIKSEWIAHPVMETVQRDFEAIVLGVVG